MWIMSSVPAPEPFFLPRPAGQRYCVHHAPAARQTAVRAALVYVHPFGEEMNKSRRMAALQARAMAEAGCAVLQMDLLGCGDSSGELSDASWADWIDDLHAACDWMAHAHAGAPLWLWGLRAGALLATDVAAARPRQPNLLLWQPMVTGKTQVQLLLRLKAAGSIGGGLSSREVMAGLRESLAAGHTVDVAGYPLPARLVASMESAQLTQPGPDCQVHWLEVDPRPNAELTVPSARCLERWRDAKLGVTARVVEGPAFWQSAEIEEAPALLRASLEALGPMTPGKAA